MPSHRVKRNDLIMSLFVLFSTEYDLQKEESIMDLTLPMERIKAFLQVRFSVSYSGNQWIYTQIRHYEEEIGCRLFVKEKKEDKNFNLRLNPEMIAYEQKRHLYINQKINVSNGLSDLIKNTLSYNKRISLLLDAGSTVSHLANIMALHSYKEDITYDVYTHNMSVINRLMDSHVNSKTINVYSPRGKVDPITNSILGNSLDLYKENTFDYIIQGVSFLVDGAVFVEQENESRIKKKILLEVKGNKVLILTGHEVRQALPIPLEEFGRLENFDYLVVPSRNKHNIKNMDRMLKTFENILNPEIVNWNYRIYRIKH